jgi:hypothetical protein
MNRVGDALAVRQIERTIRSAGTALANHARHITREGGADGIAPRREIAKNESSVRGR